MFRKNFKLHVVIRILILSLTITVLFYLILNSNKIATSIILLLLIIYQIYSLVHFVDKTNRDLARFLNAIEYSDFSQTFADNSFGSSFNKLNESFNRVIEKFRSARSEKEEHLRYLETVMQHVAVGLIAYDQNGDIQFINNAAKRVLNVPNIPNITGLHKLGNNFVEALFSIKSGDRKTLKIIEENDIIQLVISAIEFKLRDKRYTLVSLQNIQSELEEKEMEAWQQLIRVLTHEIMNSITPISSLASTMKQILKHDDLKGKYLDEETMGDVSSAVNAIERRSEGLIHFVNSYRNLTKIPKPNFQIFPIHTLFQRIRKLLEHDLKKRQISFHVSVKPETLEITADPELIEQVILNLIINAEQALTEISEPKISLSAQLDEKGRVLIKIIDNGPGITEEVMEKIFIPFFTTKKSGSGIGLSLARQIMRSHRGSIRVTSNPNVETVFTLRF